MCAGTEPTAQMVQVGFRLAEVCCADVATSSCGFVSMSDGSCMAAPMPDSRCPSLFGGLASGCCTKQDLCGIDASLLGGGCRDLDAVKAMFPAGFQSMVPAPRTCEGMLLQGPDAGMTGEDAGL
jgi:hypothetical protein